jgi:hypothetical protein
MYVCLGGFVAAFTLLVLVLGTLNSLGLTQGKPDQNISSAIIVFLVLIYPSIWIIQTGLALYRFRRSGRLYGIILGSILLVGLNVILLLIKDRPDKTGKGLVTFHVLMILIGLYSLVVLAPRRVSQYLQ